MTPLELIILMFLSLIQNSLSLRRLRLSIASAWHWR